MDFITYVFVMDSKLTLVELSRIIPRHASHLSLMKRGGLQLGAFYTDWLAMTPQEIKDCLALFVAPAEGFQGSKPRDGETIIAMHCYPLHELEQYYDDGGKPWVSYVRSLQSHHKTSTSETRKTDY